MVHISLETKVTELMEFELAYYDFTNSLASKYAYFMYSFFFFCYFEDVLLDARIFLDVLLALKMIPLSSFEKWPCLTTRPVLWTALNENKMAVLSVR